MQVVESPQDRRIRRLPGLLANQIAAGEVIERPSSVVKELLENSLDAGADRISLELRDAGLRLVRVRDNGSGIAPDDLALALARHATSKVSTLDELESVTTMGFRGEALASIAAISRLTIDSTHSSQANGWRVSAEAEAKRGAPEPLAHPVGTTVEVRDLFFNTPARRKFLRSQRTELQHIENVFRRIALGHMQVALSLRHEDKSLLTLPLGRGTNAALDRLAKVCGAGFVHSAAAFEFEAHGMRVFGWVATPDFSRSQTDRQFFFVNGRSVRDSIVAHAIRQAYRDDLPPGRHAAYVVYLELNPRDVDVNVHPAKLEVRFLNARLVHDFVASGLRNALREAAASPVVDAQGEYVFSQTLEGQRRGVREQRSAGYAGEPQGAESFRLLSPELQGNSPGRFGRPVGVCANRYLLTLSEERLWLIDVVAARERHALATLHAMLSSTKVRQRPVLVPPAVSIDRTLLDTAESELPLLQAVGLELRRIAPDAVSVRQLPLPLERVDMEALATQVLACWQDVGSGGDQSERLSHLYDAVIRVLARCHARRIDWDCVRLDQLLCDLETMNTDDEPGVCISFEEDSIARLFPAGLPG